MRTGRPRSFALTLSDTERRQVTVVGRYLNPPENALVLCVDEKSQLRALEHTQPIVPLGLGYVEGITPRGAASSAPAPTTRGRSGPPVAASSLG